MATIGRSVRWLSMAALLTATLAVPASGEEAAAPSEPISIGVSLLFANPYFAEFEKGLREAGEPLGIQFSIQNSDSDVSKEAAFFDAFINQQVDLVLAAAINPDASVANFKKVHDAGIPIVCYGTCINDEAARQYAAGYVASDNLYMGRTTGVALAEYINTQLGGKAKALILSCESFQTCKDRRTGIDEELAKAGVELEILDQQEGYLVDKATPIAQSMLTAHPDAQIFIGQNEDAIVAAANVVKERGLTGQVAVFGCDINPIVASLIVSPDGIVKFTTGQSPYDVGHKAVAMAQAILAGETLDSWIIYADSPWFSHDEPESAIEYLATHQ